ncbi:MAG: hypothetical protein J6C44_10190 [Muribaculaceae bacterium]|nr:hypothetical protein [Muribaculaceae bacterium]
MNINNPPVVYKRPLNKKRYFLYGNLELPHHIKAYVDSYCHEYQTLSEEDRLLDLGFVLLRGYNLKKEIKDWLKDHPEISEDSIVSNIGWLMMKFHDIDEPKILNNMDSMDLYQMIDYAKPILLDCYIEEYGEQKFDDNGIGNASRRIEATLGGHYLGEVHTNGKWQWTEYKLDKFDWRTIK